MNARTCVLVLATAGLPAVAGAQSAVSGTAEWTVAETANTTDSQANSNGAFWQNYTLGFHSSIVDPRLLKYDTEVSFRTNRLTAAGSNLADQHGKQDDLGFRVGAFVLPAGAFPFFVQASRVFAGSAGELAVANTARGGLAPQTGASLNLFETENRNLNMGGSVNLAGLPRAEIAYRRGTAITTGGLERAEQRDDALSASLVRETSRTRQALRYQRTGYEYALSQAFSQRLDSLDYDFTATVWGHVQVVTRAGRRGTFAESSLLGAPIDPGDRPYQPPPTDGRSSNRYVTSGISYEPNSRIAVRLNGTWDQQRSEAAAMGAALGTGSLHAELVRGLALNAAATSGWREQIIDGRVTQVKTANGVGGVSYSGGPRWLNGSLTANIGQGTNATPEGERGVTRSWSREASLASTLGWFGAGAGYEKVRNEDAILDYGNYDSERVRASINAQSARLSLTGSADQLYILRGVGATLARNRQQTFSGSLSGRLWRDFTISGTMGGFSTTYLSEVGSGFDRSLFWGVGTQVTLRGSLRALAWVRSEDTTAASTHFDQKSLSGLARLEYRLRAVNVGFEYRHNDNLLHYGEAPSPSLFRGHQIRFTLTRQFGFVL